MNDLPDENDPYIAAGNEVNEVLLKHRAKWASDDEIQDMLAEAFIRGVRFAQFIDVRADDSNNQASKAQ